MSHKLPGTVQRKIIDIEYIAGRAGRYLNFIDLETLAHWLLEPVCSLCGGESRNRPITGECYCEMNDDGKVARAQFIDRKVSG